MESSPFEGKGHMGRRIIVMLVGLFILSFGIAMTKKANLGTAPISCIPATLTDCVGMFTLGEWTILFNILLLALEIVLLGKKFPPVQILQLALAFYLGYMTDLSMWILDSLGLDISIFPADWTYVGQWIYAVVGFAILAFGVMVEIRASLLVVPGDGLVMVLTEKIKKYPFHKVKIVNDTTMAIIACVISLTMVGYLTGAREGTIFAAIAIGTFIGWYRKAFGKYVDRMLGESDA